MLLVWENYFFLISSYGCNPNTVCEIYRDVRAVLDTDRYVVWRADVAIYDDTLQIIWCCNFYPLAEVCTRNRNNGARFARANCETARIPHKRSEERLQERDAGGTVRKERVGLVENPVFGPIIEEPPGHEVAHTDSNAD